MSKNANYISFNLELFTLTTKPIATDKARSEDPPELIKGNGIPKTGINPIATPIFIIT